MTLQNFTLGTFAQGAAGGGGAFESIATATGTGSSATITFSSLPTTYQHLQIRGIARNTSASNKANFGYRINGDTGFNYGYHRLYGTGASAAADGAAVGAGYGFIGDITGNNATSNIVAPFIIDVLDYNSTTKNKVIRCFVGNDLNSATTDATITLSSSLWLSTSAVNSFSIFSNSGNWTTQTSIALYGIKGA